MPRSLTSTSRAFVRAAQGAGLALGAPLGWLALRVLAGASPADELTEHGHLYAYLLGATTIAFSLFGLLLGAKEEALRALNASLAEQAVTDSLTGLKNHQYFFGRLDEELARLRRHKEPVSLIAMDLDHFKRVNDTHGHPVGDRVLSAIAASVRDTLREEETFARLGGEEFAILLPGLDGERARQVAERVYQVIESVRIPLDGGDEVRVTASLGVATATPDAKVDASDLYHRADAALYDAKSRGHATIVVH
jgi:diguanylate cyclase (GGDEF)-like protein